ncbi:MAG: hypothetical protein GX758_00105 [Tenericutes bacterium]|nr:hypothetical protein [Mycoplasmatota bacterium]
MENFDKFLESFMTGDYFLIFLVLMLIILMVLILALIKTRNQYIEMLNSDNNFTQPKQNLVDPLDELENLKAVTKDDVIDEDKPIIKQIDIQAIKKYDDIIDEYEFFEEENAVISTDELEKRTKERMEALGSTNNQVAIQKYEEEQEKRAIISYEQLLKNASNITLNYKEETKTPNCPKVNKVEVQEKEVTQAQSYLAEEEFLNILKEFRLSL